MVSRLQELARTAAWVGLQAASQWHFTVSSRDGFVLDEGELEQSTVVWAALHGHLEHWPDLLYGSYAGGGALTLFMTGPFMKLLGSSVGAWKLTLAVWSALLLVVGRLAARRVGGNPELFCAALVFAPSWYLDTAFHGVGSHSGSMLFVLGALAVLRGPARPWAFAAVGLLAGLGISSGLTASFAVPVLAGAMLLARPGLRRLGEAAGGFLLGLAPMLVVASLQNRPDAFMYQRELWEVISLGHLPQRWAWLASSAVRRASFEGLAGAGSLLVAGWCLGLVGAMWRRSWMTVGLVGAFLLAFGVVDPTGAPLLEGPLRPNDLRYLAPLVVLGALVVSVAGRHSTSTRTLLAVLVVGPGLAARVQQADVPRTEAAVELSAVRTELLWSRMPPLEGDFRKLGTEGLRVEPRDPIMRRLAHEHLGRALGDRFTKAHRSDVAAFDEWLQARSPLEQADVLRGLAAQTVPRSGPKMDVLAETTRALLERAWSRAGRPPCSEDGLSVYHGGPCDDTQAEWTDGRRDAQFAVETGTGLDWSDRPALYVEGAADLLGQWHPELEPAWRSLVPADAMEAWDRGFAAGWDERPTVRSGRN